MPRVRKEIAAVAAFVDDATVAALAESIAADLDARRVTCRTTAREQVVAVLAQRRAGKTAAQIGRIPGMPTAGVIYSWSNRYPAWREAWREAWACYLEDRIAENVQDSLSVYRTKEGKIRRRVDGRAAQAIAADGKTVLSLLGRLKPREYGDTTRVVGEMVSITIARVDKAGPVDDPVRGTWEPAAGPLPVVTEHEGQEAGQSADADAAPSPLEESGSK